jgi:purine-binding chemotaxis protein CheW
MITERQFCTFHLGNLFLGIEVLLVQEVIRAQAMTRVPLAARAVRGLINLRGQIVTAIDLRERLGLPPLEGDRAPMNVVVRTDEGAVSLLVDEIGDVLEVAEADYEDPPGTLDPAARELIRGVYKLSDRLLLVLDTEKALGLEPAATLPR